MKNTVLTTTDTVNYTVIHWKYTYIPANFDMNKMNNIKYIYLKGINEC